MDWNKVAERLTAEAAKLRKDAPVHYPNYPPAQEEMKSRAAIFETLAAAIREGAD